MEELSRIRIEVSDSALKAAARAIEESAALPDPSEKPRRLTFFELPQHQRAMHYLDSWAGLWDEGSGQRVTARYAPRSTGTAKPGQIDNAVLESAEVGRVLGKLHYPQLLRQFILFRYPRVDGDHRRDADSFLDECPELRDFAQHMGMKRWEVSEMLRTREKELIRDIGRHLSGRDIETDSPNATDGGAKSAQTQRQGD